MGCLVRARYAPAGCGCPRCVRWATCCAIDSTAHRAYSMATAVATALHGRSCYALSPKTLRTSLLPLTTSSTSRNHPTSARTVDALVQQALQDALATAHHRRWTAASCFAVAGATAHARSASPSAATAPSTGAATSAAATALTRASCTSASEALRRLAREHSPPYLPDRFAGIRDPDTRPLQYLQPHSPRFIRVPSLPSPPIWGLLKPLAWGGMNPLAILMDLPQPTYLPLRGRPLVALLLAWPGGERRIRRLPYPGVSS